MALGECWNANSHNELVLRALTKIGGMHHVLQVKGQAVSSLHELALLQMQICPTVSQNKSTGNDTEQAAQIACYVVIQ